MKTFTCLAVVAQVAVTLPTTLLAATIDGQGDTLLTAFAELDAQGLSQPLTAFDEEAGPPETSFEAEVLLQPGGLISAPVPRVPNSLGTGFLSAAGDSAGNFGVGVNNFFASGSSPKPFSALASGTITRQFENATDESQVFFGDVVIPAPVITLFGAEVRSFLPSNPALDLTAQVLARIVTTLTRPDGSFDEFVSFEYGMRTFRDPLTGEMRVTLASSFAPASVTRDGLTLAFALPEQRFGFETRTVFPGETLTLDLQYLATGGTGFGENGVFAAIGDPFDIQGGGGRFEVTLADDGVEPPDLPSPVPLPATLPLLAAGFAALAGLRRWRRGPEAAHA